MLVQQLIRDRVVPLPFQVHRLTLLLGHQMYLVLFVLHQAPFFVLAAVHDSIDGVVFLPSPQFGLGGV